MFVLFVMQSYLIEVRGLKPDVGEALVKRLSSYLIEVRGLKLRGILRSTPSTIVVSYRGTWVETRTLHTSYPGFEVVSYRGTWVETSP